MAELENYGRKGCIVFKEPQDATSPGVAVFTSEADNFEDAPKRPVHFTFYDDYVVIEEFGFGYFANLNLSKEYIQLSEEDAKELREKGKVMIKQSDYRVIKQETERRYEP
ncbi:MAG: hypothetical protein ACLFSL_05070 [Candidatus Woesearchaeota archaeon]